MEKSVLSFLGGGLMIVGFFYTKMLILMLIGIILIIHGCW